MYVHTHTHRLKILHIGKVLHYALLEWKEILGICFINMDNTYMVLMQKRRDTSNFRDIGARTWQYASDIDNV